MTHIQNIPHILEYGITHSSSPNANPDYVTIGDGSLIAVRNEFPLTNGRTLGDYIPFYFGVRMPMLYVMQKGFNMVAATPAVEIVYCVTSVNKVIDLQLDFVFTDGHARNRLSTQYSPADLVNIDSIVDWRAIEATYWRDEADLDLKRRKEAEFLVLGDIVVDGILGFIVFNEDAKKRIVDYGASDSKVLIKSKYYFKI